MVSSPIAVAELTRFPSLRGYGFSIAAFWTLLLVVLGLWDGYREMEDQSALMQVEANARFQRDKIFVYWLASHGGVYVPITEHTPPNPFLAHVAERDLITPSGIPLTLVSPTYMLRQMQGDYGHQFGQTGHLTSLRPVREENEPDAWEAAALQAFEEGTEEACEFVQSTEGTRLRLMRPLLMEESCLKCHAEEGYQVGDRHGALSLSIPAAPFFAEARAGIFNHTLTLGLLWLLGLFGLILGGNRFRATIRANQQAEGAVRRGKNKFLALVEAVPTAIFETDVSGKCVFVNAKWRSLAGMKFEDALGDGWGQGIHEDDRTEVFDSWAENVEKEEPWDLEYRFCTPSGKTSWVLGKAHALRDDSGKVTGYLGSLTDITSRKKAEENRMTLERQVQHTQKLESLGVLAGGIAHDFNNLMMAVLGNADLALEELSPLSPVRGKIRSIESASKQAADLAQQMLAYSGKGHFVLQSINAVALLEEITHLLEVSISKKAVLKLNYAENLPTFTGDVAQVRQVIMNLILNASEAIGNRSGVISLSVGAMDCDRNYLDTVNEELTLSLPEPLEEGIYTYFEVADSGCGMDSNTLSKIFDPFFTTKFTGRGLGLSAVLGIMRGHRGALKIYTEVGKGTTIKALFPANFLAEGNGGAEASASEEALGWQGSGTILVADDEESICAVVKQMLEHLGFSVLIACDGRAASEIFRQHAGEITCVILDLTMPHLSGEEVFREIRLYKPSVHVILSSGYDQESATQHFVGKGLAGFLQKPYKLSVLRETLRNILPEA